MRRQICIQTDSLILREFTRDDYHELYALTRQTEITDILPDWRMSHEQLTKFLQFVISSYENFNSDDVRVLLAIEHKQDQRLIGWCGVFPNDKLPPSEREVAYAISKDYRNKGYITEAVRAILSYVFNHTSLNEIVAIVKPFNVASRRVIEKAGFKHLQLVRLSDNEDYNYFIIDKARIVLPW